MELKVESKQNKSSGVSLDDNHHRDSKMDIESAICLLFYEHRLVVEGSGAPNVGGILKHKDRVKGKKVFAVVCGQNIDFDVFTAVIA